MRTEVFTYKTTEDGTHLQADVHFLPDALNDEPRPIGKPFTTHSHSYYNLKTDILHSALILHGGGFSIGSRSSIPASQVQTLASYGFVVVSPDYRLCPQISVLDGPLTDALDAFIWAKMFLSHLLSQVLDKKKQKPVTLDPKRTVALGSSAGGTIALWLVS